MPALLRLPRARVRTRTHTHAHTHTSSLTVRLYVSWPLMGAVLWVTVSSWQSFTSSVDCVFSFITCACVHACLRVCLMGLDGWGLGRRHFEQACVYFAARRRRALESLRNKSVAQQLVRKFKELSTALENS